MHRRQGTWLLMLVALVTVAYTGWLVAHPEQRSKLPFSVVFAGHEAMVVAVDGVKLPVDLKPGDLVDLPAVTRDTRIALVKSANLNHIPDDSTYRLVVRHPGGDNASSIVTVHSVTMDEAAERPYDWGWYSFFSYPFCLAVIAILALWKGTARDTLGLALWAIAFLLGLALQFMPSDGARGLAVLLASNVMFLLARLSFYLLAASMASPLLTPRAATAWKTAFFITLGIGAVQSLFGPLALVATGWAELMQPAYGVLLTFSYVIPVAMLFMVLPHANATQRLRLKWVTGASTIFVAAIFLINSPIFGYVASAVVPRGMFSLAFIGLLYGVVRSRVIDFSVVLNRTLVYAATTSLILGLFALLESLVERFAVGERASLLLNLLVPLALGASLTTVHRRIDDLVERLIFRRQYRQESALRRFAREAAFVVSQDRLKALAVTELRRHTGAPWAALYESGPQGFGLAHQCGEQVLPACVDNDDPAVVALRAHEPEVELHDRMGALRIEGYAFPLQVRGQLLGLLVIASRPDEHYSSEERELFAHVSHEVGAALFALRAQASELMLDEARAMARASEERARASEALLVELMRAGGLKTTT